MFREFFHYVDTGSLVHRLDPRTKIAGLCSVIVLTAIASKLLTLVLMLFFIALAFMAASIPSRRVKVLLTLIFLTALTLIPSQTFFYWGFYYGAPVHVWFWIAKPNEIRALPIIGEAIVWATSGYGICACEEGFANGVIATMKFSVFFLASAVVLMTTKPGDIVLTMNKLKVPHKFSFLVITALRFVPIVVEELILTIRAQQARGMKLRRASLRLMIQNILVTLTTTILNCVRRGKVLSIAIETRAFGAKKTRTCLKELRMTKIDELATTIFITVLVSGLTLSAVYPNII